MKSFFIVVVLMLRNGGAQTRIGGAPRAKESSCLATVDIHSCKSTQNSRFADLDDYLCIQNHL